MKSINDYIRQHKKGAAIGGGIAAAVLIGAAATAGIVSSNANKQPEAPTTLQAAVVEPSEASVAAGNASISAPQKPGAPKPSETPTENSGSKTPTENSVSEQSKPASSQDSNGKTNSNDKNTGKNPSNSNDKNNSNQKPENANNTSAKPAHEHSYKAVSTVSATCTSGGYTVYECSCGASYHGGETSALGHSYYQSNVVEATTESEGYTEYTCSNCGDTYRDNYTPKIEQPKEYVTEEDILAIAQEAIAYAESKGLIVDKDMAGCWAGQIGIYREPTEYGSTREEELRCVRFKYWGGIDSISNDGYRYFYPLYWQDSDGDWVIACGWNA